MNKLNLEDIIRHIDPARLDYSEWVEVGMGLKEAGYDCRIWDDWSKGDAKRYHSGECEKKWAGFHGSPNPVTAGTVVNLAMNHGWSPERRQGRALEWDDEIGKNDYRIIDSGWVEEHEIVEPEEWNPAAQLTKYLEVLFEASENVGYVTQSWQKDKEYFPTKGNWDRTAGELIQELNNCNGDIGAVIGDWGKEAGAWIRFNPLDGKGIKNENVTDFRYALVESDVVSVDKQNAIIRELELPAAALVYSGGKSVHAIVRIDAKDYAEYRKRVDYLYEICKKNGLVVDVQNKNPSRLSRMPGVVRDGHKQFLIDTNIGKSSWKEWKEWIEEIGDPLPNIVTVSDIWNEDIEPIEEIVSGLLCRGDKMMLSGPSKAGKSFMLLELCISIAEGRPWLNFRTVPGSVIYVNLEIKENNLKQRIKSIYASMNTKPKNNGNLHYIPLRGHSAPLADLSKKLVRMAAKYNPSVIVIDPIYKIISGDENSASDISAFCNELDKISTNLNCALVYCHHHSKGTQGQKQAMDRASGSGVFARDADALIDMIKLHVTDDIKEQRKNKLICGICGRWLDDWSDKPWREIVSQDDALVGKKLLGEAAKLLTTDSYKALLELAEKHEQKVDVLTAWRTDITLREYPKPAVVDLWFDWPVHYVDNETLTDAIAEDEHDRQQNIKNKQKRAVTASKSKSDFKRTLRLDEIRAAMERLSEKDIVATKLNIAKEINELDGKPVTKKDVENWMNAIKAKDNIAFEVDQATHEVCEVPF